MLAIYADNPETDIETLELKLDEAILRETAPIETGLSFIRVLYVVAPLLGLLGTVVGMIATFQMITLFGTGDPRMMAGGISTALVTTVLGLVVAIPLTLLHSFLQGQAKALDPGARRAGCRHHRAHGGAARMIWFYEATSGAIRNFMELGGDVLWAIMFVAVPDVDVYPGADCGTSTGSTRTGGVRSCEAWETRLDTTSWYAKRIRDGLVSEAALELKQNIGLIKALIAICPLLGLLGTVTGMITVFDVMTYSGGGNARAMAGGVSMATVPTMAGMVAALSGVYFGTWLEHKAQVETETLEDLLQHH